MGRNAVEMVEEGWKGGATMWPDKNVLSTNDTNNWFLQRDIKG